MEEERQVIALMLLFYKCAHFEHTLRCPIRYTSLSPKQHLPRLLQPMYGYYCDRRWRATGTRAPFVSRTTVRVTSCASFPAGVLHYSVPCTNKEMMRTSSGGAMPRWVTFTFPCHRACNDFGFGYFLRFSSSHYHRFPETLRVCALSLSHTHTHTLSQFLSSLGHPHLADEGKGPLMCPRRELLFRSVLRMQRRRERMCAIHSIRLRLCLRLLRRASPRLSFYSTRP